MAHLKKDVFMVQTCSIEAFVSGHGDTVVICREKSETSRWAIRCKSTDRKMGKNLTWKVGYKIFNQASESLQKYMNMDTDDRGLGGHLSNYTSGWFELHRLLRHNKNGASEPPTTKTGSRSRICPGQVHFFWHVPLMFMGRYVAPFFVVDSWWN